MENPIQVLWFSYSFFANTISDIHWYVAEAIIDWIHTYFMLLLSFVVTFFFPAAAAAVAELNFRRDNLLQLDYQIEFSLLLNFTWNSYLIWDRYSTNFRETWN